MRNVIVLALAAPAIMGASSCNDIEAWETSFNSALERSWKGTSKTDLEAAAADAMVHDVELYLTNVVIPDLIEENPLVPNDLSLDSATICLDLGDTPPTIDLTSMSVRGYADGSVQYTFSWRIPGWVLTNAKLTINARMSNGSEMTATYTNLSLSADGGCGLFWAADKSQYYLTDYLNNALLKYDLNLDSKDYLGERNADLGMLIVKHVVFRAICTGNGYNYAY